MTRRLFPVIHLKDRDQAVRNARLAADLGLGVFLIHHRAGSKELFRLAAEVHIVFPELWIGVNALSLTPRRAAELCPDFVRAIWTDQTVRDALPTTKEVFGGIAFKYQTDQRIEEASEVAPFVTTLVTSGDATGEAAKPEKLRELRSITDARLGLASGVSVSNIGDYPEVSDFLVASSIGKDFYNIDKTKLTELYTRFVELP